jgi:Ca2+-binding RTX toxin-like protein
MTVQYNAGPEFRVNTTTANDQFWPHVIYNPTSGALMYDADGSGSGAAITIVVLSGHPTLSAADIFLS